MEFKIDIDQKRLTLLHECSMKDLEDFLTRVVGANREGWKISFEPQTTFVSTPYHPQPWPYVEPNPTFPNSPIYCQTNQFSPDSNTVYTFGGDPVKEQPDWIKPQTHKDELNASS